MPPLVVTAAIASGCVLERGPPPPVDERSLARSIEEREEPGTIFTLRSARADTVDCIHCGAANAPGRERCEACGRSLAVKVYIPCPECSSITDPAIRAGCEECGGRGFLEAPARDARESGDRPGTSP
jgi:hypothetical protein